MNEVGIIIDLFFGFRLIVKYFCEIVIVFSNF